MNEKRMHKQIKEEIKEGLFELQFFPEEMPIPDSVVREWLDKNKRQKINIQESHPLDYARMAGITNAYIQKRYDAIVNISMKIEMLINYHKLLNKFKDYQTLRIVDKLLWNFKTWLDNNNSKVLPYLIYSNPDNSPKKFFANFSYISEEMI